MHSAHLVELTRGEILPIGDKLAMGLIGRIDVEVLPPSAGNRLVSDFVRKARLTFIGSVERVRSVEIKLVLVVCLHVEPVLASFRRSEPTLKDVHGFLIANLLHCLEGRGQGGHVRMSSVEAINPCRNNCFVSRVHESIRKTRLARLRTQR